MTNNDGCDGFDSEPTTIVTPAMMTIMTISMCYTLFNQCECVCERERERKHRYLKKSFRNCSAQSCFC
ncbi:hypothetical protein QVD17_01394 [Tagetes erecta]|uniref:Uncharacterized protein n=1 Tax=Tagetes erecta TaxID=13708 RepID=A0AAD8L6X7_TARER|nr:hypothetical protein QVD17_01394 [Tagetes erecta]